MSLQPSEQTVKRKLDESENEINENETCVTSKTLKNTILSAKSTLADPVHSKAKEEHLNKIRNVIESHFDEEINYKQYELDKINDVSYFNIFFSFYFVFSI